MTNQELEAALELKERELHGLRCELEGWKDGSEAARNEYAALILRSNHKIERLAADLTACQAEREELKRSIIVHMGALKMQEHIGGGMIMEERAVLEALEEIMNEHIARFPLTASLPIEPTKDK